VFGTGDLVTHAGNADAVDITVLRGFDDVAAVGDFVAESY
jgi:hypothetical protein